MPHDLEKRFRFWLSEGEETLIYLRRLGGDEGPVSVTVPRIDIQYTAERYIQLYPLVGFVPVSAHSEFVEAFRIPSERSANATLLSSPGVDRLFTTFLQRVVMAGTRG